MSEFKVGGVYTVGKTGQDRWHCLAVDNNMGWFRTKAHKDLGIAFIYTSFGPSQMLVEAPPPEEWVAIYWTDGFKTNVEVGSKVYETENECSQAHMNAKLFHSVLRLR